MSKMPLRRARIPHGVADSFNEEAAAITSLERTLHNLFPRWGYARVIPPTLEYYDMLVTQSSPQLQAGRRDVEGNRQPRLRRFADDGQAVRPRTHLDLAPAAG